MEEKNKWHGYISKSLFCLGIGGLFTYSITEWSKIKLPVVSQTIEKWIASDQMQHIRIGLFEIILFVISIFMILMAALFVDHKRKTRMQVFLLIALTFINIGGILTVIGRGELFPFFILVVWLTITYLLWIGIDVIKMIYSWCIVKEQDEKFNMAKLTFIWAVIALVVAYSNPIFTTMITLLTVVGIGAATN